MIESNSFSVIHWPSFLGRNLFDLLHATNEMLDKQKIETVPKMPKAFLFCPCECVHADEVYEQEINEKTKKMHDAHNIFDTIQVLHALLNFFSKYICAKVANENRDAKFHHIDASIAKLNFIDNY